MCLTGLLGVLTDATAQMVVMSSLAAAVQGMDESVINGAQIIYPTQFGIGGTSRAFLAITFPFALKPNALT